MKLFEVTNIPILSRALDAYALRQKAVASNIANIGTEGYRAKEVKFEEELGRAARDVQGGLRTTDSRHLGGVRSGGAPAVLPTVEESTKQGDAARLSGINNVDMDQEMADLARNQIQYKFASRLLADTFRGIQKSIRGTQ